MPNLGMEVGIGQPSLRYIPTTTVKAPTDTNTTDKLIVSNAPMLYAREGTTGYSDRCMLCADGDKPELVALQRQAQPSAPVGVVQLPKTNEITGAFQLDLPYTGSVPSGT